MRDACGSLTWMRWKQVIKGDFNEPEKRSVEAFTKFVKDNTGVAA